MKFIKDFFFKLKYNQIFPSYFRIFYKIFIIYVLLFKKFFLFASFLNTSKGVSKNLFFRHFTFISLFSYFFFGFRFRVFQNFLICIFNLLVSTINIKVEFFLIGNLNITALFLSRYLCIKLSHGYRIKELTNPLLRELRAVSFDLKCPARFIVKKYILSLNNSYRKSFIKTFILKIFIIYKRLFLKFFYFNNS